MGNPDPDLEAAGVGRLVAEEDDVVLRAGRALGLDRLDDGPGRLRAKKKPLETRTPERGAQGVEKVRLVVPADEGSQTEVLGRGAEAAPAVVALLERIGVVG